MIKGSRRIFSWDCFVCSLSLYSRNNTIICFLFHKKFLSLFDNIFLSLTTFSLKYFPSDVCLLKSEWLLSIVTKVFCSVYECTLVQSSEDCLCCTGSAWSQHNSDSVRSQGGSGLRILWLCLESVQHKMSSSILLLSARQQITNFLCWFLVIGHHLIVQIWQNIWETTMGNKWCCNSDWHHAFKFVTNIETMSDWKVCW